MYIFIMLSVGSQHPDLNPINEIGFNNLVVSEVRSKGLKTKVKKKT